MKTKGLAALILSSILVCSVPAAPAEGSLESASDAALAALSGELGAMEENVWVYRDFGDTGNHFTQKAKMAGLDGSLVLDMDEDWRDNPHSGRTCIRCGQVVNTAADWGGWMFMNGWLDMDGTVPRLNDGSADGQGLDLRGAWTLRFWARGEHGGESVEFFTCGFGYDGVWGTCLVPYPDSALKRTLGSVTLTDEWQEYSIDLYGEDMRYIVCGFGYVLSGETSDPGESIFYLDDIRFNGDFSGLDMHAMLRSYDTDNACFRYAAFSYDNALAAMAFLSAGRKAEAAKLLDAFVYAVENDRYQPGRVRNAYAAGDITAFPGWDGAARLPGWYDAETRSWAEDRYQVGSNVGNTSYVALALLQYDALYGNEKYLDTAAALMDWVIENCTDGTPGFTGGCDGSPENGDQGLYVFTYKSIEHNIDAYAAFRQLYARTGQQRYADAAAGALAFIRTMYDEENHVFWTGTKDDGVTPSRNNLVLDAQVWACLALGNEFAPYEDALDAVEKMRIPDGGYPFCASNVNGGWWAEGTAYTALMYRLRGEDDKADSALEALMRIQLDSGLFPAATVENLSTGFELFDGSHWLYGTAPHIAPAAWFVMAVNGFNPYSFSNPAR